MLATLSKPLTILLVLLQLIAPLVHAHVHEDTFIQNIHLPEFEQLEPFSIKGADATFSIISPSSSCSLIVNIGKGVRQNQLAIDHVAPVYFLPESFTFKQLINQIQINAPPLKPILFSTISFSLHSSRAPPQNI